MVDAVRNGKAPLAAQTDHRQTTDHRPQHMYRLQAPISVQQACARSRSHPTTCGWQCRAATREKRQIYNVEAAVLLAASSELILTEGSQKFAQRVPLHSLTEPLNPMMAPKMGRTVISGQNWCSGKSPVAIGPRMKSQNEAWSVLNLPRESGITSDRKHPTRTEWWIFNWSGKQSLSTGVGLKYRDSRGRRKGRAAADVRPTKRVTVHYSKSRL